jgi:deoxycytidine triphosphate deaminase
LFFIASEECEVSYADRKGKYMNQLEITYPTI